MFQSTSTPTAYAMTAEVTGRNLPIGDGPWKPMGNHILPSGATLAGFGQSDVVMRAIEVDGYFIANSGPFVTRISMQ